MKISEVTTQKPIQECTSGATSSGGVATSIGGGNGFGLSPFMKPTPKRKTKKRTK